MNKFLLFLFFQFSLVAQSQNYDKISAAFGSGNVLEIAQFLDSKVDLNLTGKEINYSKEEVQRQLKTFYSNHTPSGFKIVHKGVSQNDVRYMIGELTTGKGVFRVTIYLRNAQSNYLIQSLEFEKD